MIMSILIYILIFISGAVCGFLLKWWLTDRDYSGTIFVNRDKVSEKIVYSLELDEYPEKLEFKKVVIFKVDSPNRD